MAKNIERGSEQDSEPQTRQELLNILMSQYSSLAFIPKEDLEKLGYVKIVYKGGVKLALKEELEKRTQLEKEKAERAPFGIISVEGKATSVGRRMEIEEFRDVGEDIDYHISGDYWAVDDNIPELYGQNSPAAFLFNAIKSDEELAKKIAGRFGFVQDQNTHDYFIGDIFIQNIAETSQHGRNLLGEEWEKSTKPIEDSIDRENKENVSAKETEQVYNNLETLRGKLSDPAFYAEDSEQELNSPIYNNYMQMDYRVAGGQYEEPGTLFEVSRFVFAGLLSKYEDFASVAEKLESAKSRADFLDILATATVEKTQEETDLTISIKTASVEEKREMSKSLKALKTEREEKSKLLAGIKQFYNIPETVSQNMSRIVKDTEKKLIRGSSGQEEEFTLDARPDKLLDANPGLVSGDCTEGKPLPFNKLELPLYNVKVLRGTNGKSKHVGNIYLVETETTDNRPVWHLDAIQIPVNVKWNDFVENLFGSLIKAAKVKKVSAIAVSREASHISNYDYIQDAVLEYCKDTKVSRGNINVPDYSHLSENYSSLQCDGDVFLIPISSK